MVILYGVYLMKCATLGLTVDKIVMRMIKRMESKEGKIYKLL